MVNVFSVYFNNPDFNYTDRYSEFEVLQKKVFGLFSREQRFQAGKCSYLIFLSTEDLSTVRNLGTGDCKLHEFSMLLRESATARVADSEEATYRNLRNPMHILASKKH